MIVVRLSGGLGNQLFQYATARSLAQKHGQAVVLDLNWFKRTPKNDTKRSYELDQYRISAKPAAGSVGACCYIQSLPTIRHLNRFLSPWRVYSEAEFGFDSHVLELPANSYLIGYWQSYRYFSDIAEVLRDELRLKVAPSTQDEEVLERMWSTNSVSVHIRRGDYASRPNVSAVHGVCTSQYYELAASQIVQSVAAPTFYVFSDDPDWAEANVALPGPTVYVRHNQAKLAAHDLRLMSSCKHHILANSTFSWWAAWLNRSPTKTVVAPAKWFAANIDTTDLIPNEWTRC